MLRHIASVHQGGAGVLPRREAAVRQISCHEGGERCGGQRPPRGTQGGSEPGAHTLSLAEEPSKPDGEAKRAAGEPESEEA